MATNLEWLKTVAENDSTIIAVDFDGTLCEEEDFPKIGKPKLKLIETLKEIRQRNKSVRLILWTCREDADLQAAIDFCKSYGLEFDAHNDNVGFIKSKHGRNSRKIAASIYIDDRAFNPTGRWDLDGN